MVPAATEAAALAGVVGLLDRPIVLGVVNDAMRNGVAEACCGVCPSLARKRDGSDGGTCCE